MDKIFDFYDKLNRISSIDEFKKSLGQILSLFGFETYAYTVKLPDSYNNQTIEVLHNWQQEFVDRYVAIHSIHCPRVTHLWTSEVPLIYDRVFINDDLKRLPHHPAPVKAAIEHIIDFGYHAYGFSLSTCGKFGDRGILTLQNKDYRKDGLDAISLSFHVVSAFFPFLHMKYVELCGWKPPGIRFDLTPRERECLRWAADGKNTWETGMILNLSERTVVFHLANAQKKLMATNKVQAVARAVLYKMI
ncbi:MAG: autoinducer binding domain-containing protein [Magnetococcales bacterium]|nr:autoinducer binding domain-containing protein [Magnetococcales bacterium]